MVWFDPQPTPSEATDWIHPGAPGIKHKVGRWPHPNTNRVDARFILRTDRDLAHTAYRRLFSWNMKDSTDVPNFPEWQEWGEWDLLVSVEGTLAATSDTNSFGWVASIEIKEFLSLPTAGVPGIMLTLKVDHAASGHFRTHFYEFPEATKQWFFDRDIGSDWLGWVDSDESVGFPYDLTLSLDYAMSDCFLFPQALPPPTGFAVFNGIDAYIKNRSRTNDTTGAWRQEFDIRIHTTEECHYLCKSFNTTRFCRIRTLDIGWINRFIVFSTPLPLNTWLHIDFRFQWDGADGLYRVAVDGGTDDTAANSNFNVKLDQFGKRAEQVPFGVFDLKNFLFRNGTAVSSVVYLDQKFTDDACDDGPDARHGDTFFMTLPSCP